MSSWQRKNGRRRQRQTWRVGRPDHGGYGVLQRVSVCVCVCVGIVLKLAFGQIVCEWRWCWCVLIFDIICFLSCLFSCAICLHRQTHIHIHIQQTYKEVWRSIHIGILCGNKYLPKSTRNFICKDSNKHWFGTVCFFFAFFFSFFNFLWFVGHAFMSSTIEGDIFYSSSHLLFLWHKWKATGAAQGFIFGRQAFCQLERYCLASKLQKKKSITIYNLCELKLKQQQEQQHQRL